MVFFTFIICFIFYSEIAQNIHQKIQKKQPLSEESGCFSVKRYYISAISCKLGNIIADIVGYIVAAVVLVKTGKVDVVAQG